MNKQSTARQMVAATAAVGVMGFVISWLFALAAGAANGKTPAPATSATINEQRLAAMAAQLVAERGQSESELVAEKSRAEAKEAELAASLARSEAALKAVTASRDEAVKERQAIGQAGQSLLEGKDDHILALEARLAAVRDGLKKWAASAQNSDVTVLREAAVESTASKDVAAKMAEVERKRAEAAR